MLREREGCDSTRERRHDERSVPEPTIRNTAAGHVPGTWRTGEMRAERFDNARTGSASAA